MKELVAINRYIEMMVLHGVTAVEDVSYSKTGLPHLYWMLVTLKENIEAGNPKFDVGKVNRWLGFVHYGIIINGFTTVEDERNFTRPLFTGTSKPIQPIQMSDGERKRRLESNPDNEYDGL